MNILLLSFSLQTLAAPDRWFSADKTQHFFMGAFVQGASFGILRAANVGKSQSMIGASALSVVAVIGKETRDRTGRGTASVKDAAWGLAGAAAISPVLARTK
jgi:uncharacterized protein YfiM (DUF2279 family)